MKRAAYIFSIFLVLVMMGLLAALVATPIFAAESKSISESVSIDLEYPAEEAALFGKVQVASRTPGYTGTGYLEGFEGDGDRCEFNITIPQEGFYDLNFVSMGLGGYKENHVSLNGQRVGLAITDNATFGDAILSRVFLTQGEHVIGFEPYWGWVLLDALRITESKPIDPSIFDVSATLINPNATDEAKRLMSYLADSYGNVILSGQYSDNGILASEAGVIFMATGKRPAVLGLDMMDYTPSRVARGTTSKAVERALQCDEVGGIVTFCWHWNAPTPYLKPGGTWYRGFYTEETTIDLARIINGDDPEGYDLLMSDIDAIAEQLLCLQEAGVPILWRPLHEASGGWFWWGAHGAEAYIKLWVIMYDRLTNLHQLNNLIWLWNGQDAAWYPGDAYVDIIGEDIYAGERVYASQADRFLKAVNYTTPPKMVALSENGTLIDPDLALRDGAMWGFWATWGGEFVMLSNLLKLSDRYTEIEMVHKVYNHELVVTLDKLPDLKTYPIRD
ncbi:MAG: beta-mannosidase [Clostridia bacterium]|nr:beta-mannosidase [Clostridia bacterium]